MKQSVIQEAEGTASNKSLKVIRSCSVQQRVNEQSFEMEIFGSINVLKVFEKEHLRSIAKDHSFLYS